MRVSEMSGWIACLPHCGDGAGRVVIGLKVVTGSVVTGPAGGNVTAVYQQCLRGVISC